MDKQAQLVRTAFQLFYTRGINAVGINRVLEESGIAKKTLYHHFPSKEHLIEAAVRYRDQRYQEWIRGRFDAVEPGRSVLLELFDALDDWFNSRVSAMGRFNGCFFINASAEYGERDHAIHQACADHKRAITALIRQQVKSLGLPEADTVEITNLVVLLKEGATSMAHVQGKLDAALDAKQLLVAVLQRYDR